MHAAGVQHQSIVVRRLGERDSLEELTSLLHRAYARQVEMGLRPLAGRQSVEQTRERTASGECFVAVERPTAGEEHRILGTVLLQEVETAGFPPFFQLPHVVHFSLLGVDPAAQGRGIGGMLLGAIESRARELGARELALSMARPDEGLLRFYKTRGFREVELWQWPYTNYVSAIMSRPVAHTHGRRSRLSECFIRDAVDADGPGLISLIGAVWSEYEGCVLDVEKEERDLLGIATAFNKKRGSFWVALDESGAVVGCCGLAPAGPDHPARVELKKVYVAKRVRGTGLGARLLGWAEHRARQIGAAVVELWSDTRFLEGHRFYERSGYVRGSFTRELHDLSNSVEYHYSKRL